MADIDLGRRFFTNTYVTGSGRQNYLRIDNLEDPLFTSFTFDIDYVSSPLFYTINYDDYGYPNVEGISDRIETSLKYMYENNMYTDQGYDILPALSASILDGNKLGFGLQQNVYMDMPLYGATEYIYMVDKRNGGSNQNDARYDNNKFVESGGDPNTLNGYKLGDSIKDIVNDSDKAWAERQKEQHNKTISECYEILNDENVKNEHSANEREYEYAESDYKNYKVTIDGVYDDNKKLKELGESDILKKIEECKSVSDSFDKLKKDIATWVNSNLSRFKNEGLNIYRENKCVQKISSWDDIGDKTKDNYSEILKKSFGQDFGKKLLFTGDNSYVVKFTNLFNELKTYSGRNGYSGSKKDDDKSFLLNENNSDFVRKTLIIEKFKGELIKLGLYDENTKTLNGNVSVLSLITPPEWATIFYSHVSHFANNPRNYKDVDNMIQEIMSYQCDVELSFDENFTSDKIKENDEVLVKYEMALDNIRSVLYGYENGKVCDINNPLPDSKYGQYLAAKEKLENDDYTQAEKTKSIAQSGFNEMSNMIKIDDVNQNIMDQNYNSAIQKGVQPYEVNRKESTVVSQTVLDILGFINGMKKMTIHYPYIIQGVTGLDTAYNKHYVIKDPYLGSGEDKITLTCLESLDLRVSSMFNRYFNAIYDRQYRRERVPVNLRRFNCSIYVHDVRNFVSKVRVDKNGNFKTTQNRLLELTDMYYGAIEFRFFDCEIVPEETGNIFNDISNEAPSDMKKTNFTFTYGNCVVNFVPPSEVSAHNSTN